MLEAEAGIECGRLPGVYKDERDGHGTCPWRSGIRREGFEHVKGGRHATGSEASVRVLEVYQWHAPFVAAGRFTLAPGKHVDAELLARLLECHT